MKLLIPVEGSDEASAALDFARSRSLAPRFAPVVVGAVKLFTTAGMKVTAAALPGAHAGDAVAAHARTRRPDGLGMGFHGQAAFKSLVVGPVAKRVAARGVKPMPLIRDPRHAGRNQCGCTGPRGTKSTAD